MRALVRTPFFSALILSLLVAVPAAAPPASADPLTDAQRWASCYPWLVEQAASTLDAYQQYASGTIHEVKCKLKLMPHGVHIGSDADFVVQTPAGPVPNKANGILGGSGTPSDPYLIQGHEWAGYVPNSCPALTIENTTAYVLVANNWFHDMSCGPAVVIKADHVTLDADRFSANVQSIQADSPSATATLGVTNSRFEASYPTNLLLGGSSQGVAIVASGWHGGLVVAGNDVTAVSGAPTFQITDAKVTLSSNLLASSALFTGTLYRMDDGTEVAGNTFDGTGSYALQLSSIQASVVGSLSVHDNVFRDILVVDSDAGTVDIHDNVFNVPGGSLLGLYARGCHNGGCSTQSIHDNQFYEVRWDAMVAQGRGSIVQNTFHVVPQGTGGATWGPQHVVELAAPYQMAPSSTLFSITGNDFDIGNLDIFCDAPGMMTQSGNTVRDGSLDVGGC